MVLEPRAIDVRNVVRSGPPGEEASAADESSSAEDLLEVEDMFDFTLQDHDVEEPTVAISSRVLVDLVTEMKEQAQEDSQHTRPTLKAPPPRMVEEPAIKEPDQP
jgi:hypothetical protein